MIDEVDDFLERQGDVLAALIDAKIAKESCDGTPETASALYAAELFASIAVTNYQSKRDGTPSVGDMIDQFMRERTSIRR